MKLNQLKSQLYLFQVILLLILIIFLAITYYFYQKQYKQDINNYIYNEVSIYKKEISSSMKAASKKMDKQKSYFVSIHENALQRLQKNPNLTLEDLKKDLKQEFLSQHIDLELFLIDKSYKIYATTFLKDLGFNLSIVTEAKQFLDQTSKDGKIYISDFVSTDALDMKYKLYSYSKLTKDNYLELGFIDNSLTNTVTSFLKLQQDSLTKASLFNVSKDDKQYYYYEMKKRTDQKSKEDHYKEFVKIPLLQDTTDNVINTIKLNKTIDIVDKNIHTVYTKVYDKSMFPIIGFDNIVLKLEIDISEKIGFLDYYKNLFFISIVTLAIILVILVIMTRVKFTTPINEVLENIGNSQKVTNKSILNSNNEISEIAAQYNKLLDKLHEEIDLNKKLTLIDQLTHTYNRKAFDKTMVELLSLYKRYKTVFSFIIFDIDNFKQINDNYGHIVGDKTLKSLTILVNKKIRNTDTLFRIGGEEFVVLCKNTTKEDAKKVAEKIRVEIEESLSIIEGHTITISSGVTNVLEGDTEDSIYKRADLNLYTSKKTGKNKITCS